MQIKVKSLQGDEYMVEINNDQQVTHLKAIICEKASGLPIERQKLVYKGRTMQDFCRLGEYNLEEGCKVHLILQKSNTTTQSDNDRIYTQITDPSANTRTTRPVDNSSTSSCKDNSQISRPKSKFEKILREKLGEHFCQQTVERIMSNLHDEIERDVNSSSLDDLERLAKQKLNISGE